jgi:ligand-binding SRPBCC domain-containing protein
MRSYTFITEHWVPAPLDEVFAFFADPQNLPRLSPPELDIKLGKVELAAPGFVPPKFQRRHADFAGAGSSVEVRFRPPEFALPMAHTAHITEFVWGRAFRDATTLWPLLRWDHKHEFSALERNGIAGTLVRDLVRYSLGPGWFGALLHGLFVRRAITEMFAYRQRALEKIIGAGALIGHGFVPAGKTA